RRLPSPPLSLLLLHAPPPTSPLFPYTTLFRSLHPAGERHAGVGRSQCRGPATGLDFRDGKGPTVPPSLLAAADWWRVARRKRMADRKSTRLNSSHDQISYAVFCLKKKSR